MKVFVYGSLLKGLGNHPLLERSRLVQAEARTPPAYTLHDLGGFPAMVAGGSTSVVGEVYEVDGATLERLDRLEGHPRFYMRTRIRLADGCRVSTYLLRQCERPVIPSGDWRAHNAARRRRCSSSSKTAG